MSKSTALKTVYRFLSLLLCLALIPAAFAQQEELSGSITCENGTCKNSTISETEVVDGIYTSPKLELQTSYISDTIEPGKEYVYGIKIKNVAGKDVAIDPKVVRYDIYMDPYSETAFSDDIVEISAPPTIKAGEIINMTIRIPVPKNATGSYNGYIEMNADGKENDGSVSQINLDFTVDKQPSVPYVKTFNTETVDPITIEVSTNTYDPYTSLRISPEKEEPYFEMNLISDSSPVNLTRVKATESGTVYSQVYSFPIWSTEDGSSYESSSRQYVETYRVPGAIGSWELTILPKNTNSFSYSITVGDSEKKLK